MSRIGKVIAITGEFMADIELPSSKKEGNKTVAQSAFGPAAEQFGKEIAPVGKELGVVTEKVARLLISGLNKSVYGLEAIGEWMRDAVSARLKDVPQEKIVEPNPRISVPATQALIYSMDDEFIREMYANLLAADMNSDTKKLAHPAFVELIKEMTPAEAKILKAIQQGREAAFLVRVGSNKFLSIGVKYSFKIQGVDDDDCSRGISNLERLGLIDTRDEFPISKEHDELENAVKAEFEPQRQALSYPTVKVALGMGEPSELPIFVKRMGIYMTPLGVSFARVCMTERAAV